MVSDPAPDYVARLDGSSRHLWEPMWQLKLELRPVERSLLICPALRRLHFIRHAGAAFLSTPHTYSRLQHTLGVFGLVAHFCPDNPLLRVAALLHDVGHAPFSHSLEQLPGVDHHRWTVEKILSAPIVNILLEAGLDPQEVLRLIRGEPANPLRNRENLLHLDHLDSWVRSAQAGGILPVPVSRILARLHLNGPYLDMDLKTAELLLALIVAEARFHASAANLGANIMLQQLVRRALDTDALSTAELADMTDAEVERLLFTTPATSKEARRLWYQPAGLKVQRLNGKALPGVYVASLRQLYLAVPLAGGRPVTEISASAAGLVAEAQQLTGVYGAYWTNGAG